MTTPPDNHLLSALDAVAAYYGDRITEHGETPVGVDWADDDAQLLRFRAVGAIALEEGVTSVCDVGCGYGALLDFLRARGFMGEYLGLDLSAPMLESARRRHASDARAAFAESAEAQEADCVIASGIFNVKLDCPHDSWRAWVDSAVSQFIAAAAQAVAINVLPLPDRPTQRDDLYFEDPDRLADVLRGAGAADVEVITDYGLFDVTIVARKDASL